MSRNKSRHIQYGQNQDLARFQYATILQYPRTDIPGVENLIKMSGFLCVVGLSSTKKHVFFPFWGHDRLDFEVATVPFMFYGTGDAAEYVPQIRALDLLTHYEMGKLIAKQLGCEILNPNEERDVFYVQGVVALGKGGYMKCRRNGENVTIQAEFVR